MYNKQLTKILVNSDYIKAIQDLNRLQSNTQTIALAKYKNPEKILPLFAKQLNLAGIEVNDLNKLKVIHVSGTKGKGSTCAFLESILRASGEKTGFYNSPHLVKVTERIRIDGRPIDDEKFSVYFNEIYNRLIIETRKENLTMPSYFSFLTILAFHIFLEEKVDCAVVEVGMGGEYDPTNIIQKPIACGLTTLDYDHVGVLGKTIENIAWNKAGIVKRDVPLFTVAQEQESALQVIKSRTEEKHSSVYVCKPLSSLTRNLHLGIKGSAQLINAALACQLAKYYLQTVRHKTFDDSNDVVGHQQLETQLEKLPNFFGDALENCTWPGRCQIITYPRITFFLDGAHTRKSMDNCLEWFVSASKNNTNNPKKILMINIIGERDKLEVLRPLVVYNGFDKVLFSTNKIDSQNNSIETFSSIQDSTSDKSFENVQLNARTWDSLIKELNLIEKETLLMPSTISSIEYLRNLSRQPENNGQSNSYHVLVTGSLHFVGAILKTLSDVGNEFV